MALAAWDPLVEPRPARNGGPGGRGRHAMASVETYHHGESPFPGNVEGLAGTQRVPFAEPRAPAPPHHSHSPAMITAGWPPRSRLAGAGRCELLKLGTSGRVSVAREKTTLMSDPVASSPALILARLPARLARLRVAGTPASGTASRSNLLPSVPPGLPAIRPVLSDTQARWLPSSALRSRPPWPPAR